MFLVFLRALRRAMQSQPFRVLLAITLLLVASGSAFYSFVEGWRVLDSVYFCVITLATVGYGDFSPQTDAGKIFTIFYVVAGIGVLSALIVSIFHAFQENVTERVIHRHDHDNKDECGKS